MRSSGRITRITPVSTNAQTFGRSESSEAAGEQQGEGDNGSMTATTGQFQFKDGIDINEHIRKIGESLALTIGVDPKKVKCKGMRIYFVDEENDILMQSGLFVSGFDINNYEGEEE